MKIVLSDGTVVPSTQVMLDDGSVAREFTLPSGTAVVRVRPIPPMMVSDVMADNPDLVDPPIPLVEVKGKTTPDKFLPARAGEPEYEEWVRQRDELKVLRSQVQSDHTWDLGMVEWKRPADVDEFTNHPPKAWRFPQWMRDRGRKPRSGKIGRRVDFIRYTLIATGKDMEAAQIVMYTITNPLRSEEADALVDLFPGDEG